MRNSLNNVLSFLVTSVLLFIMMFMMINISYTTYLRLRTQAEEIVAIEQEVQAQMAEILSELEE
ncbi:MAG: hypothetical protein M0P69_11300 [Bacteroidales bacterium]|nr:hypothetical protein [Bacteroidales bacterium]